MAWTSPGCDSPWVHCGFLDVAPFTAALLAPVVQWIEQIRPKDEIEVRFLSGALYTFTMSTLRITKVNQLIKEHLGEIIGREISLKQGVFITIAKVDTTQDLRYTRVFVSVFPETERNYAYETLRKESGVIQKKLHSLLYMKPLPKLSFHIDTTESEADKVEKILKDIFE